MGDWLATSLERKNQIYASKLEGFPGSIALWNKWDAEN